YERRERTNNCARRFPGRPSCGTRLRAAGLGHGHDSLRDQTATGELIRRLSVTEPRAGRGPQAGSPLGVGVATGSFIISHLTFFHSPFSDASPRAFRKSLT